MQTPTLRPQTERSQLSAPCQQETGSDQAEIATPRRGVGCTEGSEWQREAAKGANADGNSRLRPPDKAQPAQCFPPAGPCQGEAAMSSYPRNAAAKRLEGKGLHKAAREQRCMCSELLGTICQYISARRKFISYRHRCMGCMCFTMMPKLSSQSQWLRGLLSWRHVYNVVCPGYRNNESSNTSAVPQHWTGQ